MKAAGSLVSGVASPPQRSSAFDLLQHRQQVFKKLRRVLAHRKMPEAPHDGDFAPLDAACHAERFLRGAGIVVFAGQQKQRAAAGVDLRDTASYVAVELVEIQIAFEDAVVGAAAPV